MSQAATTPSQIVEETFLGPRVVDGVLLREFAESLRGLLAGAAEQRERLREAVREGEAVGRSLAETAAMAGSKLRPAVKLLPTIDQKLAQAEEALSRATAVASAAEKAAGEAARIAAAEGATALRGAQREFDAALDRAREIESRLGQLTELAEHAVAALDRECKGRLDAAARHAQDVLGTMVAELDARAEEAIGRLTGLLDQRRGAAEAAMADAIEIGGPVGTGPAPAAVTEPAGDCARSAALEDAAVAACADIETLIESIKSRVMAMGEQLAERAARATERAEAAARRAERADELATIAENRLRAAQEQLRIIDERGREIAVAASEALAAFDRELAARMQALREMMEQSAAGAGSAHTPAATPASAAEVKPLGEPAGMVRIDRTPGDRPGGGLPGRLKF